MDYLDYTFILTTIIAATAAIWQWYTKSFLPTRMKHIESGIKYQRQIEKDVNEHRQQLELDALQSSLHTTDSLVQHLIERDNGRSLRISESLERLSHSYVQLKDMMTVVVKDWSQMKDDRKERDVRMEEILSDIDISLNKINEHMKQANSNE